MRHLVHFLTPEFDHFVSLRLKKFLPFLTLVGEIRGDVKNVALKKNKKVFNIFEFNFPDLSVNDEIIINGEKFTVNEIICGKTKNPRSRGACNSGVYSVKKDNVEELELILKFPETEASYCRELKIYEDFKFSKYIVDLLAKEVQINDNIFPSFVMPKLSNYPYQDIFPKPWPDNPVDVKGHKIQFASFLGLMDDLVQVNYYLGDIKTGNFGFDSKENVFKVIKTTFDLGRGLPSASGSRSGPVVHCE